MKNPLPLNVPFLISTDASSTALSVIAEQVSSSSGNGIDDLIAGGSVLKQIDTLYEQGAVGKACFAITHPVLLPKALEILKNDDRIEKLVVTNTIPVPQDKLISKIEVLSIAPLLAQIISRIHECESISPLLVMS